MNRTMIFIFLLLIGSASVLACQKKESESRIALKDSAAEEGEAKSVVRSAVLRLKGAMEKEMVVPSDDSSMIMGNCSPDMWANFSVKFHHPDYEWVAVTLMTKDKIPSGYTGSVKLEWMDVSMFDKNFQSFQFKGPGTLEIKTHDASPSHPRLQGVLAGTNLKGSDAGEGKTVDAVFEFDLNFACLSKSG